MKQSFFIVEILHDSWSSCSMRMFWWLISDRVWLCTRKVVSVAYFDLLVILLALIREIVDCFLFLFLWLWSKLKRVVVEHRLEGICSISLFNHILLFWKHIFCVVVKSFEAVTFDSLFAKQIFSIFIDCWGKRVDFTLDLMHNTLFGLRGSNWQRPSCC